MSGLFNQPDSFPDHSVNPSIGENPGKSPVLEFSRDQSVACFWFFLHINRSDLRANFIDGKTFPTFFRDVIGKLPQAFSVLSSGIRTCVRAFVDRKSVV